jgi:hypothetical protein
MNRRPTGRGVVRLAADDAVALRLRARNEATGCCDFVAKSLSHHHTPMKSACGKHQIWPPREAHVRFVREQALKTATDIRR